MAGSKAVKFLKKISRKKAYTDFTLIQTPLNRCLNTFDLVLMGVGNIVGGSIFILAGVVARMYSGPGLFLSYLIAGLGAALSIVCYAEFAGRIPRAGSTYSYIYVTLGEFPAFLIGWDKIMERLVAAAGMSRSCGLLVDGMVNNTISTYIKEHVWEFRAKGLAAYPDFVGLAVLALVGVVVTINVKQMSWIHSTLTILSKAAILLMIILCLRHADVSNWTSKSEGGFLPYGFSGLLVGSAHLLYSFNGYETITTAAEEASAPTKQIPRAMFITTVVVIVIYMLASIALTLLVPYNEIEVSNPFVTGLRDAGDQWAVYVISVGAILSCVNAMIPDLYNAVRATYALAFDGLLFRFLSKVNDVTQTPLFASIICFVLCAFLSTFLDYLLLADWVSIGITLNNILTAFSLITLRYRPPSHQSDLEKTRDNSSDESRADRQSAAIKKQFRRYFYWLDKYSSENVIFLCLILIVLATVTVTNLFLHGHHYIIAKAWWSLLIITVAAVTSVLAIITLLAYEEMNIPQGFKVPLVPLLPVASLVWNVALLMLFSYTALVRIVIWWFVGSVIYFTYGLRHSAENKECRPLLEEQHKLSGAPGYTQDNTVDGQGIGGESSEGHDRRGQPQREVSETKH